MTNDQVQVAMLIVQGAGLGGLFWYVYLTRGIRRASLDQLESLSKPCLTVWGELRDGNDVILGMHGTNGNIVAQFDAGSYVVHNVGSGLACNVQYHFARPNENPVIAQESRYIPYLVSGRRATLVESRAGYNEEHSVTFNYQSISGRRYRTTIQLNHHVIASFEFKEIKSPLIPQWKLLLV
jgi:hypothetical protein